MSSKSKSKRDYRAEYQRRIERGLSKGLSRSQARGHPKAKEKTVRKIRPINPDALQISLKALRSGASLTEHATDIKGDQHPFETSPNTLYRLSVSGTDSFEQVYRIII